jgi:hypothetical protein
VGLSAGEVVDVDSDPGHWANLLAIAALVLTRNGGKRRARCRSREALCPVATGAGSSTAGKISYAEGTHRRKTDYQ